jgi:hypothetical protein
MSVAYTIKNSGSVLCLRSDSWVCSIRLRHSGVPGNDVNIGYDFSLPPNVEVARQAIAGNEYRSTFPQTRLENPKCRDGRIQEEIFPGAHTDVGGGYEDNDYQSRAPLRWMYDEMVAAGVQMSELNPETAEIPTDADAKIHESHRPWPYTSDRIRVWWARQRGREPVRKVYYPPCRQEGLPR